MRTVRNHFLYSELAVNEALIRTEALIEALKTTVPDFAAAFQASRDELLRRDSQVAASLPKSIASSTQVDLLIEALKRLKT